MDSSHRNFMNLLNQGSPSQYESSSQNSPPTPQSQFPLTPPNFLQNFNHFIHSGNSPPYGHYPRFQGVQEQGSWVQPTPSNFQGFGVPPNMQFGAIPTGLPSTLHFGAAGNTPSHAAESSSPCPARQQEKPPVHIEESSDSSEEEQPKKGARHNWSEKDNERLVSAWLRYSVDSIRGTDRKAEYYWKEVATYFNQNTPANGHKRSVRQLMTHWGVLKKDLTKFCGAYNRARSTWSSGESDEMIMNKAHMMFKSENKGKPFTFEYLWIIVKDLPKWRKVLQANEMSSNKRNKNSESETYTSSSNQDTGEESTSKETRPEGQKAAKARAKGKGKEAAPSPLGSQPSQNMILYHQAMSLKAAAMIKSSRDKKYNTYLKLLDKDTSDFTEGKLKRHEAILDQLAKELAEEEKVIE